MSRQQLDALEIRFLERAVEIAVQNVQSDGGPFGAVVVRAGEVVSEGVNRVTSSNDPTAHAEINAIRSAAVELGSYTLAGCSLYSSCQPCPMCYAACLWARLDLVAFAATRDDAAHAEFDDRLMYEEVCQPQQRFGTRFVHETLVDGRRPFLEWSNYPRREKY